jgi:hypothetical protein
MKPPIAALTFAIMLFVGMMVMLEVGRRVGIARQRREAEGERGSLGTIEGAVFALFGLLMAFTFSGAATRFNEKRMFIVQEVNAIEAAYMRVQMLSPETQTPLRDLFRRYLDSRIETYRRLPDMESAMEEMARSRALREEIFTRAEAAARLPEAHVNAGRLLLPAINEMIDMANTRTMALQLHPPTVIYALLYSLGVICSLLAGYRMSIGKNRSWLHILGFVLMTVIIVYVVLDMEFPRSGLIKLAHSEGMMIELREHMK